MTLPILKMSLSFKDEFKSVNVKFAKNLSDSISKQERLSA